MRVPTIAALFVCAIPLARAQNLVPNPSFEEYTTCPDYVAQVNHATGWQANAGSPDYFNACDTTTVAGITGWVCVPQNFAGYQNAATGAAYVGVITYVDSAWAPNSETLNEYVGIYLSEPLIPGIPIYLSFKAAPSYGGGFNDRPTFVCSGVGMRFQMMPMDVFNPQPNNNQAAIHLEEVLDDSASWTLVKGEYVPDSAYQYLVIGNFFDHLHCQPQQVNFESTEDVAYAYIDDVCVSYDSTEYLNFGVPAIGRPVEPSVHVVYLNNGCDLVFNKPLKEPLVMSVWDGAGRSVRKELISAGVERWPLDVDRMANGYYVITLISSTITRGTALPLFVSP